MGKYLIALQLAVVGMGTVLITLYGLSLFIRINSRVCGVRDSKKSKNITEKEADLAADKVIEEGISARKVAAISAAIYSYLEQDGSNYKIISITRNKSNWKR